MHGITNIMKFRAYLAVLGVLCLIAALDGAYHPQFAAPGAASSVAQLAQLLSAYQGSVFALDPQAQTSNCQVNGQLPDHACSPGAVFASSTVSDICTPGYSKSVRNVSAGTKKKVYAEYGISYPQPTGSYELDHLIPLELGGSNDTANLFPEAAEPAPGFHEKDLVEDYLHQEVCSGSINLAAAQMQIANNWVAVYNTMSTATIAGLKQQFHSWAD